MVSLIGVQVPRVSHHPVSSRSDAADCAWLASAYGLVPDEWQRRVLEAWMGRKADGRWAAGRWGLSVPRQNGKNGVLEMVELFFLAELGLKVLHTAHQNRTAREAFTRIASFFERPDEFPELAEMVVFIRQTNGQERIKLNNGGEILFLPRSPKAGRGFTADVLVCDEAQEYEEEDQAALLPTISSAPSGDPLQILVGTPPSGDMAGDIFTRMRDAGVAGKDRRLAWVEWSVDSEANPANKSEWAVSNPSLGIRLNAVTVADEFDSMSREMFARERLGRWDVVRAGQQAVDAESWDACASGELSDVEGAKVFGVRFTADGSSVALAGALRPDDEGAPFVVEPIAQRPASDGSHWLVDFLVERHRESAQIVIDGRSGVGFLVNALRTAGVPSRVISTPGVSDVVAAHSMLEAAIRDRDVLHPGHEELDKQVRSAVKRKIGSAGGFGWDAAEGGSVALLDAVTLAHWGARTTKRKPGRRQRFR